MKAWQLVLFGLLSGLLAAGLILLVSSRCGAPQLSCRPRQPQLPSLLMSAAQLQTLAPTHCPPEAGVEDAIEAAGGTLPEAYTTSLNLAAPLSDGSKVLVPEQPATADPSAPVSQSSSPSAAQSQTIYPININTADQATLMELPGIGESKAQAIITYREQHGAFTSIEDIQNVSGIGPATFENLKDLITIY